MQSKQRVLYVVLSCALILSLAYPGRADVLLREDFDDPNNLKVELHRVCYFPMEFPWEGTFDITDGIAKVRDMGVCRFGSCTGFYRLEPWVNYELVTRLKILGSSCVVLLIRTDRCVDPPCWGGIVTEGFRVEPDHSLGICSDNELLEGSLDEWHEVRIAAVDSIVTYFLDGEKVKEDNTDIVVPGGFAIYTEWGGEFWLDYVEVRELPPASVHPDSKIAACWGSLKL